MTSHYPIAAVARMTGLTLDTIRAWERRYGAVVAARGAKGRVYTDAQVERLRRLAALVAHGHAISDVAPLSDARLAQMLRKAEDEAPAPDQGRHPTDDGNPDVALVRDVIAAIERYDYAAADREVGRLAAVMAPRDLVYQVALPLMREVGARWHDGRLSVAQEHMVSAIVSSVMATLVRLHPAVPRAPRMLFASPEGELHEFGLRAAAMLAAAVGIDVVYLGTSVPAPDIAAAAARTGAAAVVIGLTGRSRAVASKVPEIRDALGTGVELWTGGGDPLREPAHGARLLVLQSFEDFEREAMRLLMAGTRRSGGRA